MPRTDGRFCASWANIGMSNVCPRWTPPVKAHERGFRCAMRPDRPSFLCALQKSQPFSGALSLANPATGPELGWRPLLLVNRSERVAVANVMSQDRPPPSTGYRGNTPASRVRSRKTVNLPIFIADRQKGLLPIVYLPRSRMGVVTGFGSSPLVNRTRRAYAGSAKVQAPVASLPASAAILRHSRSLSPRDDLYAIMEGAVERVRS